MDCVPMSHSDSLDATDIAAVVLSIFAPGLGHIILGQTLKGLLILTVFVASCGLGYLVSTFIALDAYLVARVRKQREVGSWEVFPEHRQMVGI